MGGMEVGTGKCHQIDMTGEMLLMHWRREVAIAPDHREDVLTSGSGLSGSVVIVLLDLWRTIIHTIAGDWPGPYRGRRLKC